VVREVWRQVPSHPDLLASSLGRIMVIPYVSEASAVRRQYGGAPTYGQWDGMRFVYPRRGRKTLKVARLVCEAFKGLAPADKRICMHMDENARNNQPENLAWGTQKENLNAPKFLAYCRSRTGENSTRWKSLEL
jgi:hypothetical protein